ILVSCQYLKIFSLKHSIYSDPMDELALILFSDLWACSETLEELYLPQVGSLDAERHFLGDVDVDIKDGSNNVWVWDAETHMSMSSDLETQVVQQIKHMPRLRRLTMNKICFRRTKRLKSKSEN
ncbi:hypothetical protein BGX26_006235, partial [Mortierella sp. AD094]